MLERLLGYTRGIAARRRLESEADEELAFHLEHEIDANVRRGMSPAEARRVALAAIGGLRQTSERVRDVRRTPFDTLWRDIRYAVRALWANPAFTLVALVVLTLSIGASTTIFSVVDAVVLRGLPFPESHRIVAIAEPPIKGASDHDAHLASPQEFLDWQAQQTVFTGLAAVGFASISLKPEDGHEPETLETQAVTADFFNVLGSAPMLGRTFTAGNEVDAGGTLITSTGGRTVAAVISYRLWQRRFGGAPDVIGRRLPGQRADFEILGVMPPSFAYPVGAIRPTDVWIPNVFRPEDRVRANEYSYRLQVMGRLRGGVSIDQARAQIQQITAGLAADTPRWFEDRTVTVEPLQQYLTRSVRAWMLMLLAAVGFVMLIACVNLANLMLVRASARRRELVIRAALGASRWDLTRAVLAESLVLSFAGAVCGAFAAWATVEAVRSLLPADVPRVASIAVDVRVLTASMVAALASGLLFGAAPALQFSRLANSGAVTHAMRANSPNPAHQWLRSALIITEVAVAVVLLVGSGLFLASFARVASVNLGIDPRDVLTVRIRPLVGADNWEEAQRRNRGLLRDLLDDVRQAPGVETAALVGGGLPLRGDLRTIDFGIPGKELPAGEDLDFNEISADYFRVLRVPLLKGRLFQDDDRQGSEPVAIINAAAADRYFPGEDPIGRTIRFNGLRRVVGVVGSIRHDGPETNWRRQGFIPLDQSQAVGATLVLRLSRSPSDVLPRVKSAIWSRFPGLALPDVQTLSFYLNSLVAERRLNMYLLTSFGVIGVVIACVGIYGVFAYVVALRTHEIGIRIALGANPARILRSVLARAVTFVAAGLGAGLIGAWLLARLITGFLFHVEPHDPWVYALVSAALVATGLTAAFVPARRAARVDPLVALRTD
jgi:predicted permease